MKLSLVAAGIVLISIIALLAVNYLPKQEIQDEREISYGKPSSPLGSELFVEDSNLLIGETTRLTLRAFIEKSAYSPNASEGFNRVSNVTMTFELPDNLEYVSGELSWQGDIQETEIREIQIIVGAKNGGLVEVAGSAIGYSSPGSSYRFGKRDFEKICVTSSPEELCAEEILSNETQVPSEYLGPGPIGNQPPERGTPGGNGN